MYGCKHMSKQSVYPSSNVKYNITSRLLSVSVFIIEKLGGAWDNNIITTNNKITYMYIRSTQLQKR